MLIFWKVRYFHRQQRTFGDHELCLNTESLDPATRAAIEFLAVSRTRQSERGMLRFRSLFAERDWKTALEEISPGGVPQFVALPDYLEDELGTEITSRELGPLLTGDPEAILVPSGMRSHDLELMRADPKPIPLEAGLLSDEELRVLAYFARDFRELSESAFRKDGPGSISAVGSVPSPINNPTLATATTDDEIRSFITVFRRFYMFNEPANLSRAVDIFVNAMGDHPYGKWVDATRNEYNSHLAGVVAFPPFVQRGQLTFTRKNLIDVYLYTQYAHQPDKRREREYEQYLAEVDGNKTFLTWLFLSELWACGLDIINAGRVIVGWFKKYCEIHGISPSIVPSIRDDHEGLGTIEKKEVREKRLFDERVEELAKQLWAQNECPPGGHEQFRMAARTMIENALSIDSN